MPTNFITNTTYLTNEIIYNISQLDKVWYQDFTFWSFVGTCFIAWTGYRAYTVYQKQLHHSRMKIILDLFIEFQTTDASSHHDYNSLKKNIEHKRKSDRSRFILRQGSTSIRACYIYYHILEKREEKEFAYFQECIHRYIEDYIKNFEELRTITKNKVIVRNKALIQYCNENNIHIPTEYKYPQITNK